MRNRLNCQRKRWPAIKVVLVKVVNEVIKKNVLLHFNTIQSATWNFIRSFIHFLYLLYFIMFIMRSDQFTKNSSILIIPIKKKIFIIIKSMYDILGVVWNISVRTWVMWTISTAIGIWHNTINTFVKPEIYPPWLYSVTVTLQVEKGYGY